MIDITGSKVGISVVVTVLNEEKNIRDLLVSLVSQEQPMEIIIIDALSTDKTMGIIEEYASKYCFVRYARKQSSRGAGRNLGVSMAQYDYVAFIDGDGVAGDNWLKNLRQFAGKYDVVAGAVHNTGRNKFSLERLKLFYKGFEVTYPSANLMYSVNLFNNIGGFDEYFVTAEDIDLNIRAVKADARTAFCPNCIVYSKVKDNSAAFRRQAYWNGYGRMQLKLKYGKSLKIEKELKIKNFFEPKYIIRNFCGLRGYMKCAMQYRPKKKS
ncbi:MAG: glycosyltransferase [Ferroplasma sp.]